HGDRQCDGQAEAPFLPRSNADCGGHRRVAWHLRAAVRGDELHGAEEASRIAGGEQFFWIGAVATRAAQFLRRRQAHFKSTVQGGGAAIAQLFFWCQAAAVTGAPAAALASIGWECAMKFARTGGTSAAKSAGKAAGSRYRKSSLVARMSLLAGGVCESRPTELSPWS